METMIWIKASITISSLEIFLLFSFLGRKALLDYRYSKISLELHSKIPQKRFHTKVKKVLKNLFKTQFWNHVENIWRKVVKSVMEWYRTHRTYLVTQTCKSYLGFILSFPFYFLLGISIGIYIFYKCALMIYDAHPF